MDKRDLPKDRLATTDVEGKRVYLYPSSVKGFFKNRRTVVQVILVAIFLVLPWIRINGHQALLFDVARRRFAVFGVTFWAHEAPILFFYFAGFALTMGFITAVFGRVWCGWACPQTVFIEGIFRRIEIFIEGDHVQRKMLDESEWNIDKFFKKAAKWSSFLAVSLIISHSFLAYFIGTDELFKMVRTPPAENMTSFLVMAVAAAITLFDFGWFREQFCVIACPYGRFQSVMMDNKSLAVLYDHNRPDCVNCFKCVQVCPTGVDIRRGLQMECIACTACADACDDVMTKVKKPLGLIRYSTREEIENKNKVSLRSQILRPRTIIYAALLTVLFSGLVFTLSRRELLDLTVFRAHEAPYQLIAAANGDGIVINHFVLELENKSMNPTEVRLSLASDAIQNGFELVTSKPVIQITEGTSARSDIFVKFPKSILKSGHATVDLHLGSSLKENQIEALKLVGPFQ